MNGRRSPVRLTGPVKSQRDRRERHHERFGEADKDKRVPVKEWHRIWSAPELLDSQSETRIVLLPVEPYLVHVYWDVNRHDLARAKRRLSGQYGESREVLRFIELNDAVSQTAIHAFDVPIELSARNCYVPLWSSDKIYRVLLGLKTKNNRFFALARSNIANTSPSSSALSSSEKYARVTQDFEVLEVESEPACDQAARDAASLPILQEDAALDPEAGLTGKEDEGKSTRPYEGEIAETKATPQIEEEPFSSHRGQLPEGEGLQQREALNDVVVAPISDADDIFRSRILELSQLRMGRLAPPKETESPPFSELPAFENKTEQMQFSDLTARSEYEFTYGDSS